MQSHRNAEDVMAAVEVVTPVVNALKTGSQAKIADDTLNLAGRLDEATGCECFQSWLRLTPTEMGKSPTRKLTMYHF